ncbi:MAG: hypothetical protein H0X63_02150 [Flavobacteriales bacterium]|nr:hypothetical protein [Flavobacteriales bacterium]
MVVAVCGQWSWLFAVVVALKVGRLCAAGAYPQQKDAYTRAHNATNLIYPAGDYSKNKEEKSIRREIIKLPLSKVRVLLVKPGKQTILFD